MKQVCQYAVVQFMPYAETREFANVGVVLMCPEAGFFGFKLLKRYGRVTRFFEGMERRIFLEGKQLFQEELTRVRSLLKRGPLDRRREVDATVAIRQFAELVRRRETLFRFDEPGVVMAEEPKACLDELYGFYVEREFATKEYQERLLDKAVRRLLFGAKLGDRYREEVVGDDMFHARFPFVATQDDTPVRIIKPLFLAQDDPERIYSHGDLWISKFHRLRSRDLLPDAVLLPLDAPPDNDEKRYKAFTDVAQELADLNIEVVAAPNTQRILDFARA
ncbi:MAG: DUF3037 domain-containing protein [Methyloversatilis discipulorum]|uniref:DUF3037 domain-containing protein n=1 Tax=Methyloversatilis discipulorum TaxID=1119528 RepID=UPI0026F27DE3|nr:DUF3037 domain-containing protein [Methyloversatilis discipulorum]MBV5285801.1 DUF3037 domain-containing protein [Methyloversatilis discipulorum]